MFIPLKITTEYSLLSSTIRIDELVKFLLEKKITTCSICDENLYGVMEFVKKMQANNLKPIIGLEIKIENHPIYLYPKTDLGYTNLLKINTLKELKELNINNLISLLEDIKVILPLESYYFKEAIPSAYLGYQNDTEKIEACLNSTDTIYIKDIKAFDTSDAKYLKVLDAIKNGSSITDIKTNYETNVFPTRVKEEDSETTTQFCKDINVNVERKGSYIPRYNNLEDSFSYLSNLANKGLNKRLNGKITEVYQKRLNHELNIIKSMGFVDYFLIVYDYVFFAKKNNILVGPGRGSAAGSLTSFCLGITNIDPLKYDLLFERFLNPDRITMPDIDIDFEYTKRGKVIDYVREKYGKMNVAPIMTFGTLGAKQVIRDVARCFGLTLEKVDKLTGLMDAKESLTENEKKPEILKFINNNNLQELWRVSKRLEGLKRHISTHAAGVVISSVPLDTVIPISYNGEIIMTGVTMEYLEPLGLLKMDFLALRNLTIIANVLELIKNNTGKMVDLNKINLEDKDIFELFKKGDTEGIFQYESSGMRNLILKLKPTCFSDLVAAVALFRPSSMGQIDSFVRRKHKEENITYLHPDLAPILKDTYGIIIYQEQVMQILVKIGGYSFAEADTIRRAMSKKKQDVILNDREHFISEAIKRGYEENVAKSIYDLIIPFAGYGFNKAHSVAYALIGYEMAYLKAKAPLYFITNLLNMSIGSAIKTKEYIDEAKKKNIQILKPQINISKNEYMILNNNLLLPFVSIKNLGINACSAILEERKKGIFKDYLDFVARVYGKSINKKTIASLIDSGALDEFSLTKRTMTENLDIAINYAILVSDLDESLIIKPVLENYPEYDEEIIREKELDSYGFYVTNHPASKYNDKNIIKSEEIPKYFNKRIVSVVLIENIGSIKTKKGDNMAFLTASDETGSIEFVVFPKGYPMLNNIKKGDIVKINGLVTKRFDRYQINVDLITKNF